MSYLSKRMQKRRAPGLGGWVNEWADAFMHNLTGATEESTKNAACLAAANAQSAQMDAKASDLSKNWNPSGLYSLEQMKVLVQSTMSMLLSSSSVIDKAISDAPDGADDALKLKRAAIQRKMSTEGLVFTQAMGKAMQSGIAVIDAPGLKSWIVNSMTVASDGVTAAYYVSCQQPWWLGALKAFMTVFDKVWGAAKQVVGVAVELGAQVLKIPNTIAQMWTIATYGAIGLIGLWAYDQFVAHRKGG